VDDAQRTWLYETVGTRLREARRKAELSQQKVAMRLGVGRASIANFESGNQRLPLDTIYRFAQIVKMPVAKLFPSLDEFESQGTSSVMIGGQAHAVRPHLVSFARTMKELLDDDLQKADT
jgi:transcriptional regulator with XRE-family HTH domain